MTPTLIVLIVGISFIAGFIGGIGGPGGIPILIILNKLVDLQPTATAATASTIFFIATLAGTILYYYSDGIDRWLTITISLPAIGGSYIGTEIAPTISPRLFEIVLGCILILTALLVIYQQRLTTESNPKPTTTVKNTRRYAYLGILSLIIGILAGITGIGGPALTIPAMIFLGIESKTAIGAGLASGVLITINSTIGHAINATTPQLELVIIIGIPTLIAQTIGWKYVHAISEKHAAYSIAVIGIIGGVFFAV